MSLDSVGSETVKSTNSASDENNTHSYEKTYRNDPAFPSSSRVSVWILIFFTKFEYLFIFMFSNFSKLKITMNLIINGNVESYLERAHLEW